MPCTLGQVDITEEAAVPGGALQLSVEYVGNNRKVSSVREGGRKRTKERRRERGSEKELEGARGGERARARARVRAYACVVLRKMSLTGGPFPVFAAPFSC